MKKALWGVLALLGVGLVFLGWRYYQLYTAVALWEGRVPDIFSEKLEKNADTMSIKFTSRIDASLDAVLRAFSQPERSMEFSDPVRFSQLLHSEGNKKIVEFEIVILGRPQRFSLEFTFLPEERRVMFKTVENPLSDLSGEYRFAPSPDGMKTLLTYTGTSKDKAKPPIPLAMQKSALRETFVATVPALKKGVAAQQSTARPAGAF